jgi:crossover junction endodeoxyribonuclease RuvC
MIAEKIILGIDPGTTIMGFGLISVKKGKMEMVSIHELILKKYPNHETKLKYIFEKTLALIDEYHPDEVALEAPFFGKNVQSMLKLGRAQGLQWLPVYIEIFLSQNILQRRSKWRLQEMVMPAKNRWQECFRIFLS